MATALATLLDKHAQRLELALEQRLPSADTHPKNLHTAMRYASLDGGKRIRPFLVYAVGTVLGAQLESLDAPACAVELIHAYSLVHDDLPAMDDDDLRRGKPTVHKVYDEGMAVLVGDALQTLAFYLLSHDKILDVSAAARIKMIETLATASGSRGMCGGQAIDIEAAGQVLNIAEIEDMHIHKTGALLRASVLLGAHCAPHTDAQREALDHYAKCIGLAFQVQDDILDVTSDTVTLGKQAGADQALDKPTFPGLIGLDASKQRALELRDEAISSLQAFDDKADPLRWMAEHIVSRVN